MRAVFFALFYTLTNIAIYASYEEVVEIFIQSLPAQEQKDLETFFQLLMVNNGTDNLPFINYVMWGDKPMAINGCWLTNSTGAINGVGESVSLLRKGLNLWEKFAIQNENKDYFFLIFPKYGHQHLVCINRKAFLEVVEKHILLFQYVLGPNLTAEKLLQQLIENKDHFYDVIKNDRVLLGILLGYGMQNAILGTWEEIYSFHHGDERKEDFPLISKQKRLNYEKELIEVNKKLTTSSKLKPFDDFCLPHFGCDPHLEETKQLLTIYEKNREQIKVITQDSHFLRKTLIRLFTTTSGTLDIPTLPFRVIETTPKMDLNKLASLVKEELQNDPFFHESFFTTYLEGMKAAEAGREPQDIMNMSKALEVYYLKEDLKKMQNLKVAKAYFSKKTNWIKVVPKKVYYHQLKKTFGQTITKKSKDITFHYTFHTLNNMKKEVGTIKSESLSNMIPGIALGIQGMCKGESREIHIHPEYGYGEDNFFTSNSIIVANIELLDFVESEYEAKIVEPYHLVEKDDQLLLEKYQTIKKEDLFNRAGEFWNFIKKKNSDVNFQDFQRDFSKKQPLLSKEERMKFIELHINS